jgi:hypothetical protein
MKLLFSCLLSVIVFCGYAQQSRTDILIPVTRQETLPGTKSLEAKFTANVTQGIVPLPVQFTDQSTGNPTSWKWTFGDGDSSLIQHPLHNYQAPGIYSVKLVISDGSNGFALEKKDFIRVNQNYSNCDTLRFPLPEPLTYYIITGKGYVTGNNTYGDKAVCDYFDNMQPNLVITGMLCEFSKAKQAVGHTEKIAVKVWKSDPSTGKPGNVLATDSVLLSGLVNDVITNKVSIIEFENHVQPGGSFYMGAMLPVLTGDTLCFWSTTLGKVPVNTTWILQNNDGWASAQSLYSQQGGTTFIISCAIYPKVCLLNSIGEKEIPQPFAIWPNPAQGMISIVNQSGVQDNSIYSVSDISGKEIIKGFVSQSLSTVVDVSMLKPGIYLLLIHGKKSTFSSKLIIK